jgi:hypothetical protein
MDSGSLATIFSNAVLVYLSQPETTHVSHIGDMLALFVFLGGSHSMLGSWNRRLPYPVGGGKKDVVPLGARTHPLESGDVAYFWLCTCHFGLLLASIVIMFLVAWVGLVDGLLLPGRPVALARSLWIFVSLPLWILLLRSSGGRLSRLVFPPRNDASARASESPAGTTPTVM